MVCAPALCALLDVTSEWVVYRVAPAYKVFANECTKALLDWCEKSECEHAQYVLDAPIKGDHFRLTSGFYTNTNSKKNYLRFDAMSDELIARHLLRPPDYQKGTYGKPLRDYNLSELRPTATFHRVFSDSLRKKTAEYDTVKARLTGIYEKFKNESKNGHALFGCKAIMFDAFGRAIKRAWYTGDPPELDMYIVVGRNAKGLPELRSARGTQTTENWHGVSNTVVGADNLRPAMARKLLRLRTATFNVERMHTARAFCKRSTPDVGHPHWWVSSMTVGLAKAVRLPPNTAQGSKPAKLDQVLAWPSAEHVNVHRMRLKLRSVHDAESGLLCTKRCAAQRNVWIGGDLRQPKPRNRGGDGAVGGNAGSGKGRKIGSKDGIGVVRAPRNEQAKALHIAQRQGQGTQPKLHFRAAGGPFARVGVPKRQSAEMHGPPSNQTSPSKKSKGGGRLSLNRDKDGKPTPCKRTGVSHLCVYGSVVHTIGFCCESIVCATLYALEIVHNLCLM